LKNAQHGGSSRYQTPWRFQTVEDCPSAYIRSLLRGQAQDLERLVQGFSYPIPAATAVAIFAISRRAFLWLGFLGLLVQLRVKTSSIGTTAWSMSMGWADVGNRLHKFRTHRARPRSRTSSFRNPSNFLPRGKVVIQKEKKKRPLKVEAGQAQRHRTPVDQNPFFSVDGRNTVSALYSPKPNVLDFSVSGILVPP